MATSQRRIGFGGSSDGVPENRSGDERAHKGKYGSLHKRNFKTANGEKILNRGKKMMKWVDDAGTEWKVLLVIMSCGRIITLKITGARVVK